MQFTKIEILNYKSNLKSVKEKKFITDLKKIKQKLIKGTILWQILP